jgi:hypothetical protein
MALLISVMDVAMMPIAVIHNRIADVHNANYEYPINAAFYMESLMCECLTDIHNSHSGYAPLHYGYPQYDFWIFILRANCGYSQQHCEYSQCELSIAIIHIMDIHNGISDIRNVCKC